jgi:hyperosmotically inducible protein
MKNFILGIFIGAILLGAAIWYFGDRNGNRETVKTDLQNAAAHTRAMVDEKLSSSNLTVEDIKEDLKRTGRVIREKTENAGAAIADATADARVTTTIKAKLLADSHLSPFKISVSTTDGVVTLSGTVSSYEQVRNAIQLSMDTDGVRKVISTLQVGN